MIKIRYEVILNVVLFLYSLRINNIHVEIFLKPRSHDARFGAPVPAVGTSTQTVLTRPPWINEPFDTQTFTKILRKASSPSHLES